MSLKNTFRMAPGFMITENNLNNISGWSLENGYKNHSAERNYPFQAMNQGSANILHAILAIFTNNIDSGCKRETGYKILLSMPGEIVKTSENYLRLPISASNYVLIEAKLTNTSDGLRSYKPYQRQCFYSDDRPLRFFKIYTKTNCKSECLANFTAIKCGCVKFSMPSKQLSLVPCGKNYNRYFLVQEIKIRKFVAEQMSNAINWPK